MWRAGSPLPRTGPSQGGREGGGLRTLLQRYDTTGHGQVEYAAFLRFLREGIAMDLSAEGGTDTGTDTGTGLDEGREDERVLEYLSAIDTNHDGHISIQELVDAVALAQLRMGTRDPSNSDPSNSVLRCTQPSHVLRGHRGA